MTFNPVSHIFWHIVITGVLHITPTIHLYNAMIRPHVVTNLDWWRGYPRFIFTEPPLSFF